MDAKTFLKKPEELNNNELVEAALQTCYLAGKSDASKAMQSKQMALGAELVNRLDRYEYYRQLYFDAVGVLVDLVDENNCSFDANGHCQKHNWFDDYGDCPHARARKIIDELKAANWLIQYLPDKVKGENKDG